MVRCLAKKITHNHDWEQNKENFSSGMNELYLCRKTHKASTIISQVEIILSPKLCKSEN